MKIEVKQKRSHEVLTHIGNKFFTKEQLKEIEEA